MADTRRSSFSRSRTGVGESSMISTHPLSLPGVLGWVASLSKLLLFCLRVLFLSGDEERKDDLELEGAGDAVPEGPAFICGTGDGMFELEAAALLPIRNLGTLCIFCSSNLTRARMSATICKDLLRAVIVVLLVFGITVKVNRRLVQY